MKEYVVERGGRDSRDFDQTENDQVTTAALDSSCVVRVTRDLGWGEKHADEVYGVIMEVHKKKKEPDEGRQVKGTNGLVREESVMLIIVILLKKRGKERTREKGK